MKSIVDEARDAFEMYNLEQGGVLWVGSECGKYSLSWEDFEEACKDLVCCRYGEDSQSAAYDLVIVFENCWLCRFDECGQSGWEYFSQPKLQEETFKPTKFSEIFEMKMEILNHGWEEYRKEVEDFKEGLGI